MMTALNEAAAPPGPVNGSQTAPRYGPPGSAPSEDAKQRSQNIQRLIEQATTFPDPAARELLLQCLQGVLALYGDGLARILQLLDNAGADAAQARQALLRDKLVRSLLLVHGLHPDNLATRLGAALDKIRPYLQSHGGNVELISLERDIARLRLQGTCKTCPSSSATLELAVRQSVEEACPDLMGFEVEGVAPSPNPGLGLPPDAPRWTVVDDLGPLSEGDLRAIEVGGVPVLVCKARGSLYAYRNVCPACNQSLAEGVLADEILSCRGGHRFDVHHAGLGCEGTDLHLDPLPLLAQGGAVKVSVR
jgi:Fe-S cluster biogenesis protein NfuA/nitrite reductase/ring-hydroxylating ferredoxin subunit